MSVSGKHYLECLIFYLSYEKKIIHWKVTVRSMFRKYDGEHGFELILGQVAPCRKLRGICRKHLNDFARQVQTLSKPPIFVARQIYFISLLRLHCTITVKPRAPWDFCIYMCAQPQGFCTTENARGWTNKWRYPQGRPGFWLAGFQTWKF